MGCLNDEGDEEVVDPCGTIQVVTVELCCVERGIFACEEIPALLGQPLNFVELHLCPDVSSLNFPELEASRSSVWRHDAAD